MIESALQLAMSRRELRVRESSKVGGHVVRGEEKGMEWAEEDEMEMELYDEECSGDIAR